jgi:pimeloyl-ACP methyl ester carboxylesterase
MIMLLRRRRCAAACGGAPETAGSRGNDLVRIESWSHPSVNSDEPQFLKVGEAKDFRQIAYRARPTAGSARPGVTWLGGFKSDMDSGKAQALDAFCAHEGRACLRFDYSGHGRSGGDFEQGSIGRWLQESLAAILELSHGPQILVGSSMGGWIALLAARALAEAKEADRLAGLVLIAPAVDFTEALLWPRLPDEGRAAILRDGRYERPSAYSPEPYVYTRTLIEDGRKHLLLGGIIRSHAPVRILQGMNDPDVPYQHAITIVEHMPMDPVTLTLVRDGDHRLSREEDIRLLLEAVEGMGANDLNGALPRSGAKRKPGSMKGQIDTGPEFFELLPKGELKARK